MNMPGPKQPPRLHGDGCICGDYVRYECPVKHRKPGTKEQRRMREIVARMQKYLATYTDQRGYADYSDETFIKDMLYGIGVAIDPNEYRCADGFDKFKAVLLPYLNGASAAADICDECGGDAAAGRCGCNALQSRENT